MAMAWLHTKVKDQTGFSVVEILLAVAVFGLLATAVIGALVYGRSSTADSGDRVRANYLAEEGIEATRNIRNAGYANLIDGTYGLVQSGNTWTLSGSSDANGIYNRSVTVASNGTNRKIITSNVSWAGLGGSSQTSVATHLTNWSASLPKTWANASQYGAVDATGTIAANKVATAGSYAYFVRRSATGPNFFIVNISTPASPTVVGTLTLAGTPTNIAVSGNYAYVSNSSSTTELQIVNVTTPTAPTLSGTYNANGTAGGSGVFAVGTTVYLTRAANATNDEFVVINAANAASPTRVTGYSLNIAMNEVYVNGTVAYVATASDTQEVLVINLASSPLTLGTAINLSGTNNATAIGGSGTALIVAQGAILYTATATTPLAPTVSGSLTLSGTINDLEYDAAHKYAHVGTSAAAAEFQVVNASTPATPALLDTVDLTGTLTLNGVAYNATYDVVAAASSNTAQEVVILGPN